MTGAQWLERVFDPALRTSKPPFAELRGGLEALSRCGDLSEEQFLRASGRLAEVEGERSVFVRRQAGWIGPPGSHAAPAHDHLEALLTPAHRLGDVDGVTVMVVLVELWTSRLLLRLEALRNELTDALDAAFEDQRKAYEEHWRAYRDGVELEEPEFPQQPSVYRLSNLPLSISDDAGTRYHALATATGGSEHPWRSEWRVQPGVPSSASMLAFALEGGQMQRQHLELSLPARL